MRYGVDFDRRDTVIVGDTVSDVEAARENGVRIVGVASGRDSADDLREGAPTPSCRACPTQRSWPRSSWRVPRTDGRGPPVMRPWGLRGPQMSSRYRRTVVRQLWKVGRSPCTIAIATP